MDDFYKPELGQIYKNNKSKSLYLVVRAGNDFYCGVSCLWSKKEDQIGEQSNLWAFYKKEYTLIC